VGGFGWPEEGWIGTHRQRPAFLGEQQRGGTTATRDSGRSDSNSDIDIDSDNDSDSNIDSNNNNIIMNNDDDDDNDDSASQVNQMVHARHAFIDPHSHLHTYPICTRVGDEIPRFRRTLPPVDGGGVR
jgi:RNA polymerase-binding transcription factor DksA